MTRRPVPLVSQSGALLAAAALSLVVATGTAWPQAAAPPQPSLSIQEQPSAAPPPPPDQAAAPPPSAENPGLIREMGKLIDKIVPTMKSPSQALDGFNARARDAAKGAGDALSRLAKPGAMVSGRTICPLTSNGTPDCKAAADKLCQSKGYKEGNSLNGDSAETCSAKVLIPGRQRKADDCRTDNYVTTALCL